MCKEDVNSFIPRFTTWHDVYIPTHYLSNRSTVMALRKTYRKNKYLWKYLLICDIRLFQLDASCRYLIYSNNLHGNLKVSLYICSAFTIHLLDESPWNLVLHVDLDFRNNGCRIVSPFNLKIYDIIQKKLKTIKWADKIPQKSCPHQWHFCWLFQYNLI